MTTPDNRQLILQSLGLGKKTPAKHEVSEEGKSIIGFLDGLSDTRPGPLQGPDFPPATLSDEDRRRINEKFRQENLKRFGFKPKTSMLDNFFAEMRGAEQARETGQPFKGDLFEQKPKRGTFGRPLGLLGRESQVGEGLRAFRETLLRPITERPPFKSLEEGRAFVAGDRPQEAPESMGAAVGQIVGGLVGFGSSRPISADELRDPQPLPLGLEKAEILAALPPFALAFAAGGILAQPSALVQDLRLLSNIPKFVRPPLSNLLAQYEITQKLAVKVRGLPRIQGGSGDDQILFTFFDDANPNGVLRSVPDTDAGRDAFNNYAAVGRIEDVIDEAAIREAGDVGRIQELTEQLILTQIEREAMQGAARPSRPRPGSPSQHLFLTITDQELLALAYDLERNAFVADWWDALPSENLKRLRSGGYKLASAKSIKQLTDIEKGLKRELKFLETGKEPPVRASRGRKGITVTEVPPDTTTPKLPRELANAKPRYNIGQTSYEPVFESDIDKALFIVAQAKRSKQDDAYMFFLRRAFPDMDEAALRDAGTKVRAFIKETVQGRQAGSVRIPSSGIGDALGTSPARATPGAPMLEDLPVREPASVPVQKHKKLIQEASEDFEAKYANWLETEHFTARYISPKKGWRVDLKTFDERSQLQAEIEDSIKAGSAEAIERRTKYVPGGYAGDPEPSRVLSPTLLNRSETERFLRQIESDYVREVLNPTQAARRAATKPPSATATVTKTPGSQYRVVQPDATVDGRIIRDPDNVPNLRSIGATLDDFDVLPGIREVPMSEFELTGKHYSVGGTKAIRELGEAINASNEISPLIVVLDNEGAYILEGGTRAEALFNLKAKSFPAKVVIDKTKPPTTAAVPDLTVDKIVRTKAGKTFLLAGSKELQAVSGKTIPSLTDAELRSAITQAEGSLFSTSSGIQADADRLFTALLDELDSRGIPRAPATVPGGARAAIQEPAPPGVAQAATPPQGPTPPPPAAPVTGGPGGPLDKVRGMWREPPPVDETSLGRRLKDAYRSLQEQLTDKFAGINGATARVKRIWQKENPGQTFPLELDAEAHAALMAGGPMSGIERSLETLRLVKQIAGRWIDDVDTYLHLRHNQDILKLKPDRKIAGGLQGADDLTRGLAELENVLGPEAFARVERAGRVVADHYAALLRRKVQSGLVTPKLATALKEQYPFYNPIRYIERDLANFAGGGQGRALSNTRNDLRFLSDIGSEAIRERPLLSLARATTNAEMLIRRNDAARALVKMALRDPEMKGQVTKVSPKVRVATVEGEPVFRPPKGDIRGAISFLEGGKRVNYAVPAWLENEAKHLSTIPFTSIERVGQIMNAVPRAFLTSANPAFFAANFIFDSLTVMLTRGLLPHKVVAALFRNFRALVKEDRVFSQMMEAGASISGFSGQTPEQLIQAVNKSGNLVLHDRLSWQQLFKNPLRTIERIGSQVELAPRRAVFEAELRRGTDVERAALASRRGTVDFQRAGVSVRTANSLFLYLNAGLQGTLLPLRAVRDGRAARYGLAGFAMAQLGLYAWNRQFPEYADVPLFDKYTKVLIMLPSKEVDARGNIVPHYFAIIPTLREFTAISAPLTYLLARIDGTAPDDVGEFLKTMLPSINPFGQITGGGLPVPTYLGETLTEMALNKDVFRDRDIVSVELQGKPAEEQFDEFSSETSKRVGRFLGFSPKKLDHLMRTGLGWDIISATDRAIGFADPEPVDPEIEAVIARLESIQENFPPEQVATQRNLLLNELSAAQREAVEERIRRPEPSLPFASSLIRRFYRERGGQLFRSGRETAAREAGLSVRQTQDASRVLGDVYDELFSMQSEIDEALDTQEITPIQWREARRAQGALYQGALLALAQVFPQAAQAQPRQEWSKFQEMVYTLAGSFSDRRTKAQILVAGLRAIPVDEIAPGIEDLQGFFRKRDGYIEGLSPEDQNLLRQEIDASSTPEERQYTQEQEELKPYWEAADHLITPSLESLWDQYLALPNSVRDDFLDIHPELEDIVKEQADLRLDMRQFNPNVDLLLVKWYGRSPSTDEAQGEFDRIYGDILNLGSSAPVGSVQAEVPAGGVTDNHPMMDQLLEEILAGTGG
jgi:hypothetical protein